MYASLDCSLQIYHIIGTKGRNIKGKTAAALKTADSLIITRVVKAQVTTFVL
jgi:hypothetical protein